MQGGGGQCTETGREAPGRAHTHVGFAEGHATMLPITMRESKVFQAPLALLDRAGGGQTFGEHVGRDAMPTTWDIPRPRSTHRNQEPKGSGLSPSDFAGGEGCGQGNT